MVSLFLCRNWACPSLLRCILELLGGRNDLVTQKASGAGIHSSHRMCDDGKCFIVLYNQICARLAKWTSTSVWESGPYPFPLAVRQALFKNCKLQTFYSEFGLFLSMCLICLNSFCSGMWRFRKIMGLAALSKKNCLRFPKARQLIWIQNKIRKAMNLWSASKLLDFQKRTRPKKSTAQETMQNRLCETWQPLLRGMQPLDNKYKVCINDPLINVDLWIQINEEKRWYSITDSDWKYDCQNCLAQV